MTIDNAVDMMSQALYMILKMSLPLLLLSLIVGLVVSIFQTVTSIQEQTLTFVPKIVAVFLGLILLGHWMATSLSEYMIELIGRIPEFVEG